MTNPQSSKELAQEAEIKRIEEAEHDKYNCEVCEQSMGVALENKEI